MADFDVGDVIRLGAKQIFGTSDQVVNVWTVENQSGIPQSFAQMATSLGTYLGTGYALLESSLSDDLVADVISVANLTQGTVFGNTNWVGYNGGLATTDATAPQVACLGFCRTSLPRVQIRKYLGVFTEANLSAGLWSSGLQTQVLQAMGYFQTPQVLLNGNVVQAVAYRALDARITRPLSVAVSEAAVIQRRRRVGTGS